MPRGKKPSVRYWSSRGGYCCWLKGVQHILAKGPDDAPHGETYLEALGQFTKLLALDHNKGTDDYLVSALLNQYRTHLKDTRKSGVPGVFDKMVKGFGETFGHLRVNELSPHDIDAWLGKQDNWNDTSKAHAGTLILASVSWAYKKGLIQTNPIKGRLTLPTPVLRGREASMSDELMDVLLREAYANRSREFGDFLWALRLTGARPIELRMAEAHNYQKGKLIFRWNTRVGYVHKNARKTQRDRIIYLVPELQAHVEGLVARHPQEPLFRTPKGKGWSLTSVSNKWWWLVRRPTVVAYCKGVGIEPKSLKPYFFRHGAISRWVEDGGDIYIAAQIFGTSVKVLEARYGHPNVDKLHERFLSFMATTGPQRASCPSPSASAATVGASLPAAR